MIDKTRRTPEMINVQEYRAYLYYESICNPMLIGQELFEEWHKMTKDAQTIEAAKQIIANIQVPSGIEQNYLKQALERSELSANEFAKVTGRTIRMVVNNQW
jgi:hypothetical protein